MLGMLVLVMLGMMVLACWCWHVGAGMLVWWLFSDGWLGGVVVDASR
jgi:hypothetical protein